MQIKEIVKHINNRNKKAKEIFKEAKKILPSENLKITKVRYGYSYIDIPYAYILNLQTGEKLILDMYDLKNLIEDIKNIK